MTAVAEAPSTHAFQQRLGLFDATMLVAGTMIGSGIFVVSADIARDVGSSGWLIGIWALAGFMTIIGALSYAELAGMMPQAGGQYIFLREAYSPLWGFLYGWTCFLVIQTGSIAAVAVVFGKYLGELVPWLGTNHYLVSVPDLNLKLYLPLMTNAKGEAMPFFEMEKFTISSGQLVAVSVILFLTWLNCRGVQEGKVVQNLFTVAKTLALVALIVIGLTLAASAQVWSSNVANLWNGISETDAFKEVKEYRPAQLLGGSWLAIALMVAGGAMVGALFSADAWNNVTFTAGEIRNPSRNLPLSLVLGAGGVIVLYLLANIAYLSALPVKAAPEAMAKLKQLEAEVKTLEKESQSETAEKQAELKAAIEKKQAELKEAIQKTPVRDFGIAQAPDDRVATSVVRLVSPDLGVKLMALAIMISTFGCVNGMTLMGARLYYAMAQDGLFFKSVGGLNKHDVPAAGLILQSIWSILLVFSGSYNQLLDFVIFAVLVFYVLTVSGLFILRYKMPDAARPTRALGYPVLPAIYVFLCAIIMLDLLVVKPNYTWPGLLIVLSGIPVYFLWRGRFRAVTP